MRQLNRVLLNVCVAASTCVVTNVVFFGNMNDSHKIIPDNLPESKGTASVVESMHQENHEDRINALEAEVVFLSNDITALYNASDMTAAVDHALTDDDLN